MDRRQFLFGASALAIAAVVSRWPKTDDGTITVAPGEVVRFTVKDGHHVNISGGPWGAQYRFVAYDGDELTALVTRGTPANPFL